MILGGCTEEGTASRTDIHTEETKAKCLLQRPVFPFQVTGGVGLKNGGREKAWGKDGRGGWEGFWMKLSGVLMPLFGQYGATEGC